MLKHLLKHRLQHADFFIMRVHQYINEAPSRMRGQMVSLERAVGVGICVATTIVAQAQSASTTPESLHTRVTTAAERGRGVTLSQSLGIVSDDRQHVLLPDQFPNQVDSALQRRTQQWLAALSADDRAYTLLCAVRAFGADAKRASRMQRAVHYMAQLDAMPVSTIMSKFEGHYSLGEAYYQAGDNAQVVAQLTTAFALVPHIPFERRSYTTYVRVFLVLADVLSGMPDGRRRIDSMTTWLAPYASPSAEQVTKDSTLRWVGDQNVHELKRMVAMTNLLGRPAPAITAYYWLNVSTPPSIQDSAFPGAKMKTLADGKIHVLEYGHYGCPGCIAALPRMEHLKQTAPANVEVWMVSDEGDVWGATPCTPDEMVQHLRQFYITKKQYTLPIAIWIGPRKNDVDGGTILEESPARKTYQFIGYPTFVVTDGKGIVRRMFFSYSESLLTRTLHYLLAEHEQTQKT